MWIPDNIIFKILRKEIISTKFFVFDLWMIIHFGVGILFALIFNKVFPNVKFQFLIVFGLLVLFEVFEILLTGKLIVKEPIVNIIWDIIFGMLGYGITRGILSIL